jgi:hypothetical protein
MTARCSVLHGCGGGGPLTFKMLRVYVHVDRVASVRSGSTHSPICPLTAATSHAVQSFVHSIIKLLCSGVHGVGAVMAPLAYPCLHVTVSIPTAAPCPASVHEPKTVPVLMASHAAQFATQRARIACCRPVQGSPVSHSAAIISVAIAPSFTVQSARTIFVASSWQVSQLERHRASTPC